MGMSVDDTRSPYGFNALEHAIVKSNLEVLKYLVEEVGAKLNMKNGKHCLEIALNGSEQYQARDIDIL